MTECPTQVPSFQRDGDLRSRSYVNTTAKCPGDPQETKMLPGAAGLRALRDGRTAQRHPHGTLERTLHCVCGSHVATLLGDECSPWSISQQLCIGSCRCSWAGTTPVMDSGACLAPSSFGDSMGHSLGPSICGWAVAGGSKPTQACGATSAGAFLAWLRTSAGIWL